MAPITTIVRRAAFALLALALLGVAPARADDTLDERQALHLLDRLGYGPAPGELARVRAMGRAAYIDSQLAPSALQEDARARHGGGTDAQAREERLLRAIGSRRQLEEVLCGFWLSHFGIAEGRGMSARDAAAIEREAVRPHVLGRFAALRAAVAGHPAMRGRPVPARGEAAAVRALAQYFVSAPPEALVRSLAEVWRDTGGEQRAVLRALFTSPAFLAPEEAGSKRKDAWRFVVSAVRASGVAVDNAAPLVQVLERAGAPVYGRQTVWMEVRRLEFVNSLVQGRLNLATGPLPHEQASSAPPMRASSDGASGGMVAQPGPVLMAAPTPSAAAMTAARNRPEERERLAELLASEAFLRY